MTAYNDYELIVALADSYAPEDEMERLYEEQFLRTNYPPVSLWMKPDGHQINHAYNDNDPLIWMSLAELKQMVLHTGTETLKRMLQALYCEDTALRSPRNKYEDEWANEMFAVDDSPDKLAIVGEYGFRVALLIDKICDELEYRLPF